MITVTKPGRKLVDRSFNGQPALVRISAMRTASIADIWSSPRRRRDAFSRRYHCPVGPGAAIPVKRMNALMLTAIAPATANIVCQIGEGTAIRAIPYVAL
ncbi:hypothetical protein [Bradyrhizobium zhanjiangense]|uniref:hypothetical protein n=1 Tax=Bradyrhizobium zhanjiangense TaxID=1325107 RepID=UPI001ABF0B4D|nr:hypothetical protein [Bradyrhizobium zhanjiangense]